MTTALFEVGSNTNTYTILVDGTPFCSTQNDDDGLKLMITSSILNLRRTNNETAILSAQNLWPSPLPTDY